MLMQKPMRLSAAIPEIMQHEHKHDVAGTAKVSQKWQVKWSVIGNISWCWPPRLTMIHLFNPKKALLKRQDFAVNHIQHALASLIDNLAVLPAVDKSHSMQVLARTLNHRKHLLAEDIRGLLENFDDGLR